MMPLGVILAPYRRLGVDERGEGVAEPLGREIDRGDGRVGHDDRAEARRADANGAGDGAHSSILAMKVNEDSGHVP